MRRFATLRSHVATTRTVALIPLLSLTMSGLTPSSAQVIERVSLTHDGQDIDGWCSCPSISGDGTVVAFESVATNLVPGDSNGFQDVFVHDRKTNTTTRVSISSQGVEGNERSYFPSLSNDGRYVAFQSLASNLVPEDTNGSYDLFLHDRQTGTTTRVNQYGRYPTFSADGEWLAFSTFSSLAPNDTAWWDNYVRHLPSGLTTLVSADSFGNAGNRHSAEAPSISADGRYVAFSSSAWNLVPNDDNGVQDIFVRDLATGTTTRISVSSSGAQANGRSAGGPMISADGRYVAFESDASNLVPGDTNGWSDVFVRDRQTGTTTRVSVDSAGVQSRSFSFHSAISGDGRFVGFQAWGNDLVPNDNRDLDFFVHDRQTGTTTRVSVDAANDESGGTQTITCPSADTLSADASWAVFPARDLTPDDTNNQVDIYVRDLRPVVAFNGSPSSTNPVHFTVFNAFGESGNTTQVLLSCSGTGPGIPIPDGSGRTIPLVADACTTLALQSPFLFSGLVDSTGTAQTPTIPFPNVPTGITVFAAAVTIQSGPTAFISVTSPTSFTTQ